MSNLNKVFLMGNLTRDPETKYTNNGASVTNFDIAVNRSYTKDGEKMKETEFFSITAWTKLGEICEKYLSKGRPVFIEGRLQTQRWEKDGQKHTKTVVIADNVQFLGSGKADAGTSGDETGSDDGSFNPDEPVPF